MLDIRVSFEATTDDLEYVHRRVLERMYDDTPLLRWAYRVPQVTIIVLASVGIFFVIQGPVAVKLGVAALSVLILVIMTRPNRSKQLQRIARKMIRKEHPDGAVMEIAIEVDDDGIRAELPEGVQEFGWDEIAEVQDTDRSIDVWTHDGRIISIQKRAFADEHDAEKCLRECRERAGDAEV
jgi:hypothetical protein